MAMELFDAVDLGSGIYNGLRKAKRYYESKEEYVQELNCYDRIDDGFVNFRQVDIKSSGYVVDTLEAAIWCLLNTDNYKDCVLRAVNLGEDTDTVAAVAGGLAGVYYGIGAIPAEWVERIARLEYISGLCETFYQSICW